VRSCLVRLPSDFLITDKAFPPLGLLAVGTVLKRAGHGVTIYDGPMDGLPLDYPAYGFGPTTPEYPAALRALAAVRATGSHARMVIGGPFATLNPDRCAADGFDCVVVGDGEPVVVQAFTGNDRRIVAPELPLDDYPIIDRSLVDIHGYTYQVDGRPATTIVSSRGCPWSCGFCSKTHHRTRMRSAEHVNREITQVHDDYGYTAVSFPDDIFILSRERTVAIAQHLHALGMTWRCLIRGDLALKYGRDFIHMMATHGCTDVGMGIESGSDQILATINKGETVDTIKASIRMLHDEGIRIRGYFILGLPGETPETLAATDAFLAEMHLADMDIKVYQPYPGSPIWRDKAVLDIDWDDVPFDAQFYKGRPGDYRGTVRTAALTNAEIAAAMLRMEGRYKHAAC
jgi:anaerobic magnesium-protoporphyrin IX monomethyl ester cyclase